MGVLLPNHMQNMKDKRPMEDNGDVSEGDMSDVETSPAPVEKELSVAEKKMQHLSKIATRISTLSWKLDAAPKQRETLFARLVVYKWTLNSKISFDELGASKHRTKVGGMVEEFMQLLCDLDQIQSEGVEEVLQKRRGLVREVNNNLLPKADVEFSKAKSLVAFTKRIVALVGSKTESEMDTDSDASETEQTPPEEEPVEDEPIDEIQQEPRASKRKPQSDVDYQTKETANSYIVLLRIPESEVMEDVSFDLQSDRCLVVKGNEFEIPIEVNPRKAALDEATYRQLSEDTLRLVIPKRAVRSIPRRRNPFAYDNSLHRQRRPMVWGW